MGYRWQYYDLVLLGVALSMLCGAAVGYLTAVDPSTAVISAGLVSVAIVSHALFVNGPVDEVGDLTDEVDALN